MWQYYNPNPYGKMVDDCTVRALSIIEDIDWFGAYFMLCIEGARLGDMPNANSVMRVLLGKKGYTRHIVPDTSDSGYEIVLYFYKKEND